MNRHNTVKTTNQCKNKLTLNDVSQETLQTLVCGEHFEPSDVISENDPTTQDTSNPLVNVEHEYCTSVARVSNNDNSTDPWTDSVEQYVCHLLLLRLNTSHK